MFKRLKFGVLGKEFFINMYVREQRKLSAVGVGNRTADGMFVLFLDYDNALLSLVEAEVTRLQEQFNLSTMFIIRSSDSGYHVVCLDRLHYVDLVEVLRCSSADVDHVGVPDKYAKKIWVLRCSDKLGFKPFFVKRLDRVGERVVSTAHKLYLQKVFKVDVGRYVEEDGLVKLIMGKYKI